MDKNNYQNPYTEKYPEKDPMVWDAPTPRKTKKRKKSKIQSFKKRPERSKKQERSKRDEKSGKRDYERPWLAPQKPSKEDKRKYDSEFLYSLYPDGEGPDTDLILGIENFLMKKKVDVSFEDIAGLEDAKRALKINVICPLKMKNYFTNLR